VVSKALELAHAHDFRSSRHMDLHAGDDDRTVVACGYQGPVESEYAVVVLHTEELAPDSE